eukprot:43895-Chlamydomonas_euryale.AAC.3
MDIGPSRRTPEAGSLRTQFLSEPLRTWLWRGSFCCAILRRKKSPQLHGSSHMSAQAPGKKGRGPHTQPSPPPLVRASGFVCARAAAPSPGSVPHRALASNAYPPASVFV